MALTRDFKETILARAQRDARFRRALFTEAISAYLAGDTTTGKAILRDLVNATVGFEALAGLFRLPCSPYNNLAIRLRAADGGHLLSGGRRQCTGARLAPGPPAR